VRNQSKEISDFVDPNVSCFERYKSLHEALTGLKTVSRENANAPCVAAHLRNSVNKSLAVVCKQYSSAAKKWKAILGQVTILHLQLRRDC
jgi:hypothetical protein